MVKAGVSVRCRDCLSAAGANGLMDLLYVVNGTLGTRERYGGYFAALRFSLSWKFGYGTEIGYICSKAGFGYIVCRYS